MSGFLSRRISRRKLLLSSGALAAFGASTASALTLPAQLHENSQEQPSVQEPPGPQPIEVLQHDEVQEGDAFARGVRLYSLGLEGGLLKGPGVFESEVIAAPFPFTHSVLRWNSHLATFEFRTSVDGVIWPDWRWSYLDGASMEETEGESTLVGAPRHRFLQYRARLAEGGSIWRVTAIFLNAADGPVIDVAVAPETSKPGAIDFSRAEWGCDDRVRFDGGGQEVDPRKFVAVDKLILHHTVTPEDYQDSIAEVRALYTYHARILGWGDLGYHALIDRFGRSYEGRLGRSVPDGREVFSPGIVGAHASSYNFGTSGVALIGQFHGAGAQLVPQAMLDRAVDVLEHAARQSYIDPLGSSDFLLSTGEWRRGMPNLAGHRDCNYTSCPGDNAYGLLEAVRARVAARLAMQPAPWLDVRQPAMHGNLRFDWAGSEGSEYSYHLQGWSHRGKEIGYMAGYAADLSPVWSDWTGSTSISFPGLPPGYWTMHVRARNQHGESYKATRSVVIDQQRQVQL